MLKTVLQTVKIHAMLQEGDSVVIGLSGGADSVVLLHTLLSLQPELCIPQIYAVHINHGLRNAAAEDQNFVSRLCASLQIPLKIYHANVRGLAEKERLSIEEAGRNLRYLYLNEACLGFGAKKIATGHHQNDNAETIIMNLARGAGLRGLCGIPPVNENIIRPLLDVTRTEIEKYIAVHKLEYITDASNFSHEYARNRTRHSVLPVIEASINPSAAQTIAKNAAWLRADEDYLEAAARQAFLDIAEEPNHTKIILDTEKFPTIHPAILRRVIRQSIAKLTGLSNITTTHIQAVIDLAQMKSGKEIHLPGLTAYKEYSYITISLPVSQTGMTAYPLLINTHLDIPELNQTILISQTPPDKFQPPNPKKPILHCTKSFDYGMVKGPVFLRARRPGDRIVLGGAKPFTKKLQDYFTDKKIQKQRRDSIPIIACGSDVMWVLDESVNESVNEKSTASAKYYSSDENKNLCWISFWRDINA